MPKQRERSVQSRSSVAAIISRSVAFLVAMALVAVLVQSA